VEIDPTLLATADRPDVLRENDKAARMEGEGTERWGLLRWRDSERESRGGSREGE
jgi:hypothetical protein